MRTPRSTKCVCRLLVLLVFVLMIVSFLSQSSSKQQPTSLFDLAQQAHEQAGVRLNLHAHHTHGRERDGLVAKGDGDAELERNAVEVSRDRVAQYMANNLQVEYEVLSNLELRAHVRVYLTNTGRQRIPASGWSIYLNHLLMMNNWDYGDGEPSLLVHHMSGNLFQLQPQRSFPGIGPSQTYVIQLAITGSMFSRDFVFPNWFVSTPSQPPLVIQSTAWDDRRFVRSLMTGESKWKRSSQDRYNPWTAAQWFDRNNITNLGTAQHQVIPTPLKIDNVGTTTVTITRDWSIVTDEASQPEAEHLAGKLGLAIISGQPKGQYISLHQSDVSQLQEQQGYQLTVTSSYVTITSPSNAGIFYGIQSLLDMVATDDKIPTLTITDAPRYGYRGFMMDMARNFRTVHDVEKVIDVMAMYKLNTLHLHLTDDEGWRLEINDLPTLTSVGGCRYHQRNDHDYHLEPALGSGPRAEGLGCGFYTTAEYRHLLRYANQRHVRVLPEIDLPGHARAAIIAMKVRHKESLAAGDLAGARQYQLHDPEDASVYSSAQMYNDNVLNVCLNSTYVFIDKIVSSLVKLHADIQPLEYFHFGGDEIPGGAFERSPVCQKFLTSMDGAGGAAGGLDARTRLMDYFFKRVIAIGDKYRLRLVGWQDAYYRRVPDVGGRGDTLNVPRPSQTQTEPLTAMVWENDWTKNQGRIPYELANHGYKVILCPSTLLYMDQPQEPHPDEKGLSWATRYIDMKKVFGFIPDSYYDNMDEDRHGNRIFKDDVCADPRIECTPLHKPENIIGIHAALWSEMLPLSDQFFKMLLPRMIAFAERAWHKAPWEGTANARTRTAQMSADWERFANTLGYKELPRLRMLGYTFYVPPPGAKYINGGLKVNSGLPGLALQYYDAKSHSWTDLTSDTRLVNNSHIATRSFDGREQSRSVAVVL